MKIECWFRFMLNKSMTNDMIIISRQYVVSE